MQLIYERILVWLGKKTIQLIWFFFLGFAAQVKQPGLEMQTVQSELDLSYKQRYQDVPIPEAYERLILETCESKSYSNTILLYIQIFIDHIMNLSAESKVTSNTLFAEMSWR